MNSKEIANGIIRAILLIGLITVSFWFINQIALLIISIILAIVISFICQPIFRFLVKKVKFKNGIASLLSISVFLTFGIALLTTFIPLLLFQTQKISQISTKELEQTINTFYSQLITLSAQYNIDISNFIETSSISKIINFKSILSIFNSLMSAVTTFSFVFFTGLFIAFFLLKDQKNIFNNLNKIIPSEKKWRIFKSYLKIKKMLTNYLIGIVIQTLIIFSLYSIVLNIFSIDGWFSIAFICAILNIIPYLGPILSLLVTTFIITTNMLDQNFELVIIPTLIKVLIGFTIVQFIDNNIAQPFISSKSTNAHPLEIFIVIVTAGILLGITGMIIAVPVYTTLKIIALEYNSNWKKFLIFSEEK